MRAASHLDLRSCPKCYVDSSVTHLVLRDNPVTDVGLHALVPSPHRNPKQQIAASGAQVINAAVQKMLVALRQLGGQLEAGSGGRVASTLLNAVPPAFAPSCTWFPVAHRAGRGGCSVQRGEILHSFRQA